ncbi:MAG: hypothetical protein RIS64_4215 [Bacteroidota bacterium]
MWISAATAQVTIPNVNVIPFGFTNGSLATFRDVIIHNPVTYSFPQNLIDQLGASATVDLDDNQGPRLLNGQRNWTINYGTNFGTKNLIFRSDNLTNPIFTNILVKNAIRPYVAPDKIWQITTSETWERPTSCANAYPYVITADAPLPLFGNSAKDQRILGQINGNTAGVATAYIKFGKVNGVSRNYLSRPVIILDGIDFGSYGFQIKDNTLPVNGASNFETNVIRQGDSGWDILWTGTDESELPANSSETFGMYPKFMDTLLNTGHDVIFLDFERGADYIQRNSLLLIELLKRVNQAKHQGAVCPAKNMIIGPSMGGQIARYALTRMESLGLNHDTHTFLSFDSPHRGAHIPLGVQAAAFWAHLAGIETSAPNAPSLWQSLNLPAARQLLQENIGSAEYNRKINLSDWDNSNEFLTGRGSIVIQNNGFGCLRQQYMDELNQIGYPSRTRNIALACGSFTGTGQGYSGNVPLFSTSFYEHRWEFGYVLRGDIWANGGGEHNLNVRKVANCVDPLLFNHVSCDFRPMIFAAAKPSTMTSYAGNQLPCAYSSLYARYKDPSIVPQFDNAPGGQRKDIAKLSLLMRRVAAAASGINLANLHIETFPAERSNLCFIPTISAFDLNQPLTDANMFQNVKSAELQLIQNGVTPFEAIFAPDQNLQHVEVNQRMINWVMEQIKLSEDLIEPNLGDPISGTTYNYANKRRDNIATSNIINNGIVKVNASSGAGFGTEVNNASTRFTVYKDASCGNSTLNEQAQARYKLVKTNVLGF